MANRLESLARRVEENPGFLASALADYARSEALSADALAAQLGCDVRQLGKLRLCRRPRFGSEPFSADVARIASEFGIDRDILLEAVRRADALAALRDVVGDAGYLMAARDRAEDATAPSIDGEEP